MTSSGSRVGRLKSLAPEALLALSLLAAPVPALAVHTRSWTADSEDLVHGDAVGVAVTSSGRLVPGPRLARIGGAKPGDRPAHVWSAVVDSAGNLLLGTGPDGKILKVTPSGAQQVLFTVEEPMVSALALLPGGDLLAGTAPGGKIYRVKPDGKGSVWCETGEHYVWTLLAARDGTVYAGTGDEGVLLKIGASGKAERFFDSDEAHVVSLAPLSDGGLIAGGAGRGLVYRLDAEGHARILHDDELPEARAVVVAQDGTIYAAMLGQPEAEPRPPAVRIQVEGGAEVGTAPDHVGDLQEKAGPTFQGVIEGLAPAAEEHGGRLRGRIVRIAPDGAETEVWRSTSDAPYCLLLDTKGRLVFGSGEPARLYRVEGSGEVALLATLAEGQITELIEAGGALVAATSNPAATYRVDTEPREPGVFVSRPFDAGSMARWGAIRWRAEGPSGRVEIYTRTGNTGEPDATWTAWSPALTDPDGSKVANPNGRFVQWRARLAGSEDSGIALRPATLSFTPFNRPPAIRDFALDAPKPAISGKATFRFEVADADGDPVDVELQYRAPGATPWSVAARADAQKPPQAQGSAAPEGKDGKVVWDTAGVPEGAYELRAVASDRASNYPGEGQERASDDVLLVTVDRTPPAIESRRAQGGDLEATVTDSLSPVNRLEVVRDGKVLFLARPADGVADSRQETFRIAASELTSAGKEGALVLRALDDAGNVAEKPVPAP